MYLRRIVLLGRGGGAAVWLVVVVDRGPVATVRGNVTGILAAPGIVIAEQDIGERAGPFRSPGYQGLDDGRGVLIERTAIWSGRRPRCMSTTTTSGLPERLRYGRFGHAPAGRPADPGVAP